MADSISFASLNIIIDAKVPSKKLLETVFSESEEQINYEDFWHKTQTKIIDDRFFWLYSNFGKAMPHRDIVIDTTSQKEETNPRKTTQVEPNNQYFIVYDIQTSILYVSNRPKNNFLKFFINHKVNEEHEIIIKSHFKTIEEFLEILKSVDSIKFTGQKDLFTYGGDLMDPLKNIFGFNEPEEFSIEAKYGSPIKESLKRRLGELSQKQKSGLLKTLVCIGKDEDGFNTIFNTNSFIKQIDISVTKDEQDLFVPNEVQEEFLLKIKEMQNV